MFLVAVFGLACLLLHVVPSAKTFEGDRVCLIIKRVDSV